MQISGNIIEEKHGGIERLKMTSANTQLASYIISAIICFVKMWQAISQG